MIIKYKYSMDYIISSVTLLALDSIYLSVTKPFFSSLIKNIQNKELQVRLMPSVAAYIFILFGLYTLIISKHRSAKEAFYLGMVIYGVFELTNYAIFDKWTIYPVIFETLWGGVLLYLTTKITYLFR